MVMVVCLASLLYYINIYINTHTLLSLFSVRIMYVCVVLFLWDNIKLSFRQPVTSWFDVTFLP